MNKVIIALGLMASFQAFADNTTYTWINANIIQPKCIKCHGNFSTYDGIKSVIVGGNADQSILFNKISDDSMPMGDDPLSQAEKDAIKAWINAGAPNN